MGKVCSMCKLEKNESDFLFKNKAKNLRQSCCSECFKVVRKKSYEKNKEYYYIRNKKRRIEISKWFFEMKSELSCELCGFSHPGALDFHHKDKKEKDTEVSNLLKYSKKRILEEIEKCVVLCANCHRIHHFNEKEE